MKIGVDLDGVCYDFTSAFCRIVDRDPATATKWRFYEDEPFNMSEETFLWLCRWGVSAGALFKEGDLLPGTKEAFAALRDMGHTIHIVTDRLALDPEDGGTVIKHTKDWLAQNDLKYDTIHFTGEKAEVARELKLDFFIDDKMENFESLYNDTGAYLLDRPWNSCDPNCDGYCKDHRVFSWEEFVGIVRLASHPVAPVVEEDYFDFDQEALEWKSAPGEVRVTSETGGQKGQKLAREGSLDPKALMTIAEVAGFGEQKYARLNYLNGYDWSLSYDACQRHLKLFWSGQDLDEESGLPHLAHAGWHCLAMLAFLFHGIGTDDRFRP